MKVKRSFLAALSLALIPLTVFAQSVPPLINYQGRLTDQTGASLAPGTYSLQFRLWDSPTATNGSDLIWAQQQSVSLQSNGVFNVILGSPGGTAINIPPPQVNNIAYAFGSSNVFLDITIAISNGVAISSPTEILPRQQLLGVPFAFSAAVAAHSSDGNPPGTIHAFGGNQAPFGFLFCDGSSYSGLVYSNPYAAIGTNWGAGSGTNNFNVPDFRGRTLFGAGVGGVSTNGSPLTARMLGQNGGEETHLLTVAEMPSHVHAVTYVQAHWGSSTDGFLNNNALSPQGSYNTEPTGGDQPHNTMPPFAVVNYVIKY